MPISACSQGSERQHLAPDRLDLAGIEWPTRVMPRCGPPRRDDVGFAVILGHDQQTPAVEALVAEVDDLRMAAVVFAQQRLRRFGKDPADGLQKTQHGAVVAGIDCVFGGDGLHAEPVGIRDDVGQLHRIADNHRIAGAHQCQRPCFGRHLRGFVHNHVVEQRLRPEIRPRGEGRAQHEGYSLSSSGVMCWKIGRLCPLP